MVTKESIGTGIDFYCKFFYYQIAKIQLAFTIVDWKPSARLYQRWAVFSLESKQMKQQLETPLYATLFYEARSALQITWNEYMYLDMVQKLHIHQKWCTKSLENCAGDLGLTKRGVSKMKERLLSKGLLEKNIKGHLRVTKKYTEVAVNKVHQQHVQPVNSVPKSVNFVPSAGELSSTKNNNRITLDNRNLKNRGSGYQAAKSMAALIKQRARSN